MSYLLQACIRQNLRNIKPYIARSQLITVRNTCFIPKKPNSLCNSLGFIGARLQKFCTRAYEVNTNVAKDVMLFKYENPRFYKLLNIFAICQFMFWNYLSHFAFTTLKDAPIDKPKEDAEWYRKINLGENKYRNSITIFCFMIGYGILAAAWMFTLRSVRFLVLRKGGLDVSVVTYSPFGQNRILTVPLKCMSAQESRQASRVQLPIKIQNKSLYYILDMRGEFLNNKLFDITAGLKRKL